MMAHADASNGYQHVMLAPLLKSYKRFRLLTSIIKKLLLIALLLPIGFVLSVLTHEFGHGLGAKIVGSHVEFIHVWPGYQIFPEFGEPATYEWPKGAVAEMGVSKYLEEESRFFGSGFTISEEWTATIIPILGSGINWVISIFFLAVLHFLKPNGVWLIISLTGATFYYDIFTSVIFPHFFNLPRLVFIGANYSEPILAFSHVNVSPHFTSTFIVSICVLQSILLVKIMKARRSNL